VQGDKENNAWSIGAVHDAIRHPKCRTPAHYEQRTMRRISPRMLCTRRALCGVQLSGLAAKHLWVLLNPRYLWTAMQYHQALKTIKHILRLFGP